MDSKLPNVSDVHTTLKFYEKVSVRFCWEVFVIQYRSILARK